MLLSALLKILARINPEVLKTITQKSCRSITFSA